MKIRTKTKMKTKINTRIPTPIGMGIAVVMAGLILNGAPLFGSDAQLMQGTINVETELNMPGSPTKTLYRSKKDESQFYYLPSNLRFEMDSKGHPMFSVYRYNLVYNNGNFFEETDIDPSEVYQGGTLKATFTMKLRDGELAKLKEGLEAAGYKNPKIGRMPINQATFSVTFTDPKKSGNSQMVIGPFTAPISDDLMVVQTPITKQAADILAGVVPHKDKDGNLVNGGSDIPMNVILNFSYSGYGLDNKVTVKGKWDNIYTSKQTKAEVKGNYWFFSVKASYEDLKQELKQNADISIEFDGDLPPETKERATSEVMDQIMKMAFNTEGLKAMPGDDLSSDQGSAPTVEGQKVKGKPASLGIGFAMKKISRGQKGDITYSEKALTRITMESANYGRLEVQNWNVDNFKTIYPGDWSVGKVDASISPDILPWFAIKKPDGTLLGQNVTITYGAVGKKPQAFPKSLIPGGDEISYGNFPTNGEPKVRVDWALGFAPWPQIKAEYEIENQMVAGSYSTTQNAIKGYYSGPRGAIFTYEDDLRLMSGLTLTATRLPLSMERVVLTPIILGPLDKGINWYGTSNTIVFAIEQTYKDNKGKTKTINLPLGPVKADSGSTITPFAPLEGFILSGEPVISTKLKAQAIVLEKEDLSRLVKQNVEFSDVPVVTSSPMIDLGPALQ